MNILYLSYRYLVRKPWRTLLQVALLALGIALVNLLFLAEKQAEEWLEGQTRQVDLVVGAKGSPLQLILCNLFHIDWPTGNISLQEAEKLAKSPLVKKAWPLALGDNYKGWRIVGSNTDYLSLYPHAKIAAGKMFEGSFEAVLGAVVAKDLNLQVGDVFHSQHGLDSAGDSHEEKSYRVVGILEEEESVLDQLIITDIPSVWASHHLAETPVGDGLGVLGLPQVNGAEITSLLLKFSNPIGQIKFLPYINQQTMMQAASPSFEINRLLAIVGKGAYALRILAYVLIGMGILSMLIALFTALDEQQYDMAIMRVLGASRKKIFAFVLVEGGMLFLAGILMGTSLAHLSLSIFSLGFPYGVIGTKWYEGELEVLLLIYGISLLLALLPALKAYKMPLSETLAQ